VVLDPMHGKHLLASGGTDAIDDVLSETSSSRIAETSAPGRGLHVEMTGTTSRSGLGGGSRLNEGDLGV